MRLNVLNIKDVAEIHLCSGCGICAHLDAEQIEMVDDLEAGRRPLINGTPEMTPAHATAFAACPGRHLAHDYDRTQAAIIRELESGWGPVLDVWEGYAADPEIRYSGSSGGVASALAAFAMEQQGFAGTLHIAARQDVPYLNETVLSTTREELIGRTGSRYAPTSPCDRLDLVEQADGPCVFIGKPCDVAATYKARKHRPALDEKLGLTIGFFCAGTPSTNGTLAMLKRMGIDEPNQLVSLRYRGNGWPGKATAVVRRPDGSEEARELTYEQSWGEVLTKHVQWRCRVCADHTGEFADIAVGDPWYRQPQPGEAGQSLILARTPRGLEFIRQAIEAGYLVAEPRSPHILPDSQPNLLRTRGAVWGRIWASRLVGAAAPRFGRMPMFRFWIRELSLAQKAQSIAGTIRRVLRRPSRRPVVVSLPVKADHAPSALDLPSA